MNLFNQTKVSNSGNFFFAFHNCNLLLTKKKNNGKTIGEEYKLSTV